MNISIVFHLGMAPLKEYFISGPFSTEEFEKAGFVCPKLNFALRNPQKVAAYAHEIVQERAENLLFGVLKSPIEVDRLEINIPDGQVIKINNSQLSFLCAFKAAIERIPDLTFAMFFIDNTSMPNLDGTIKEAFSSKQEPFIFKGEKDTHMLKNWLCDPNGRKNDVCIIGRDHQCNGIEVEIVVHILPADCPSCGISNSDPVIVSRAKALVITSTYQRSQCSCGWKNDPTINDCGWNTPDQSDVEGEDLEESQVHGQVHECYQGSIKEYDFDSVAESSVKGSITSVCSLEKMDEFVKDGWDSLKADQMKSQVAIEVEDIRPRYLTDNQINIFCSYPKLITCFLYIILVTSMYMMKASRQKWTLKLIARFQSCYHVVLSERRTD